VLRQWSGTLGRMRFQLRFPAPACLLLLRRRIPTPAAVQMLLQMLLQMLQILRQTILLTACSPFHPNDATARPRGSAMMRARCITGDHRHWLAGKASLHSPPPNAACRRFFIGYDWRAKHPRPTSWPKLCGNACNKARKNAPLFVPKGTSGANPMI
jgi:hypothetical protein